MIYLDMDGVLADFDAMLEVFYNKPVGEIPPDTWNDFWNRDCVRHDLFRGFKPIDEGLQLLLILREAGADVTVLTSTGGGINHLDIAAQKLSWLRVHAPDHERLKPYGVAFCLNTVNKAMYAKPGYVLVDDRKKVCDAWRERGGIAFQFDRAHTPFFWAQELLL